MHFSEQHICTCTCTATWGYCMYMYIGSAVLYTCTCIYMCIHIHDYSNCYVILYVTLDGVYVNTASPHSRHHSPSELKGYCLHGYRVYRQHVLYILYMYMYMYTCCVCR